MFAFVDPLDWLSALFNHEEINIWDKTNVIPDYQKDGGSAPDGTFELLVGWAMGFGQWATCWCWWISFWQVRCKVDIKDKLFG